MVDQLCFRRWQVERSGDTIGVLTRDGDGPAVVVVPGVMADAATWLPVVDAMDVARPVSVVDRRGRGTSSPLGDGYSVRTEIDDLHAVLDAVGGDAHLVDWSYGALIAAEAATERTGVRSLTLYEPVSRPFGEHVVGPLAAALAAGDTGRAVEIINIDLSGFSAEDVDALRGDPAWTALCGFAEPSGAELAAINAFDPAYDRYSRLDVPLTLVVGERNRSDPTYGTPFRRFAAAMPQADVVELPGLGHLAHVDDPAALARVLRDALSRVD